MEESIRFATEKKKLLSEEVHDKILEMIIKNASDEVTVLNEKWLMELFGVSKAPVREALIRLCSEGVLRSVPRFGYVVVQLQEKEARQVTRMRVLLETEALREGYERIRSMGLAQLKEQIEGTQQQNQGPENEKKTGKDVWQVWEDNEEFHLLLASFAGNQILSRFLKESLNIQKRIYAQSFWNKRQSLEDRIDETPHRLIWQALCDEDPDRALMLLEKDIESVFTL